MNENFFVCNGCNDLTNTINTFVHSDKQKNLFFILCDICANINHQEHKLEKTDHYIIDIESILEHLLTYITIDLNYLLKRENIKDEIKDLISMYESFDLDQFIKNYNLLIMNKELNKK